MGSNGAGGRACLCGPKGAGGPGVSMRAERCRCPVPVTRALARKGTQTLSARGFGPLIGP